METSPAGAKVRVFGTLERVLYPLQHGEGPISAVLTIFKVSVFGNEVAR
jgi:hypothetical protein